MKSYLIALAVGLLVGVIYGALKVRSPAPPVIALIGLLGILIGEQIPPLAARVLGGGGISVGSVCSRCRHGMVALLPGHRPGDEKHDA